MECDFYVGFRLGFRGIKCMKKIIVSLFLSCCLIVIILPTAGIDISNEELQKTIKSLQSNYILAVYTDDYDKDGTEEAFMLIGSEVWEFDNQRNCQAELWFVGESEAQKLEESKPYKMDSIIHCIGQRDFLVLTESYTSQNIANLWSVKEGKPYKEAISGHGGDFEYCQYPNVISLTQSCYDAGEDRGMKLGHTHKKYYFYWDEDGACFREYGGARITEEQLLHCDGAKDILDEIKEQGNQIDDIFYRDNQIIHINYSSGDSESRSFDNATLRLRENEVYLLTIAGAGDSLLDASNQFGIYSAAMIPEIAVYPDELPVVFLELNREESSEKADNSESQIEREGDSLHTYEIVITIVAFIMTLIAIFEFIIIFTKLKKQTAKRE